MGQGVISNLTYERLGVLASSFPAYQTAGSTTGDLMRVNSLEFSFSHPALDVKSVGSPDLISKNGESPIMRQPNINCSLSYIFTSGENEEQLGLYVGTSGSMIKNFYEAPATDDINLVAVAATNKLARIDLNQADASTFSGYDVIGIGNCFMTNYEYNASVGSLPNCKVSYACSNMKFDTYIPGSEPTLPAINLSDGSTKSPEVLQLYSDTFSDHMPTGYVGGIMPGDVVITITKNAGDYGGITLEHVEAAIQNMTISLPIPRQDIYGFGSDYVYDRKLKLPIIGSLSTDFLIREFATGETDSFFTNGTRYNILIENKKRDSDGGSFDICSFLIEDAQLKQQSFSHGVGNSSSVSSEFSFGVGPSGGLTLFR